MAVLVEAISVIVRRDSVDRSLRGGWAAFVSGVPNATLCSDGQLARVGFMDPDAAGRFVTHLQSGGLDFLSQEKCVDIAVVDQQWGSTAPCDWLEFGWFPFGEEGGWVSACWLLEGRRIAAGIHLPGTTLELAIPQGWEYETSLSKSSTFVPTEDMHDCLQYLRTEAGLDVFLDSSTGREVFKSSDQSVVTRRRATLKRDAPGVGVPVVDQLRQAGLVTAEMQRCGWLETQRYQTGELRSVNLEGRATAIRLR